MTSTPALLDEAPGASYEDLLDDVSAPIPTGPACPHCGAEGVDTQQTWCRRCGYYGVLRACVPLEPWEREQTATQPAAPAPRGLARLWRIVQRLPSWGWKLALVVAAMLVVSAAARLATPALGPVRSSWGAAQFSLGALAFLIAHAIAFFAAVSEDDRCRLLDFVLRPIFLWNRVFKEMPRRFLQAAIGAGGLSAAVFAVLIVGVPCGFLTDWGVRERPSKKLVQAIVQQAQQADGGEQDLEGAVRALEGDSATPPAKEEKPRQTTDCVVVGYSPIPERPHEFSTLIVAGLVGGRLQVVGKVSTGVSAEDRAELFEAIPSLTRTAPFVPCTEEATWLEPRIACRVSFTGQTAQGALVEPRFEALLSID